MKQLVSGAVNHPESIDMTAFSEMPLPINPDANAKVQNNIEFPGETECLTKQLGSRSTRELARALALEPIREQMKEDQD
jgi:hypothetical protein